MTLIVHVGRRVPRQWFKRTAKLTAGFVSFQTNIWLIIKQSLQLAKKKANQVGTLSFVLTTDHEIEDSANEIEWMKVVIQGTEEQELEEYNEALKMYSPLGSVLKKQVDIKGGERKFFKSKLLNDIKVKEAYDVGYGAANDNNISNKLLELNILTHVELIKDYSQRQNII
jgi:hypothetical protein